MWGLFVGLFQIRLAANLSLELMGLPTSVLGTNIRFSGSFDMLLKYLSRYLQYQLRCQSREKIRTSYLCASTAHLDISLYQVSFSHGLDSVFTKVAAKQFTSLSGVILSQLTDLPRVIWIPTTETLLNRVSNILSLVLTRDLVLFDVRATVD